MEQRERRIEQGHFLIPQRKKLIRLGTDVHGAAQGQAILLRHRRRRVQLIKGRLHRPCKFTGQGFQHDLRPLRMMHIGCNDLLHDISHGRQDKHLAVRGADGLFTPAESRPAFCQRIKGKAIVLVAELRPEVIVVINDGAEVLNDFVPFLTDGFDAYIVGILRFFLGGQVAISGNQLPDPLFHHGPLHYDLCTVSFIGGISVDFDTIGIVLLPQTTAGNDVGAAAGAVDILQKSDVFLCGLALLEEFIDAELSIPVVVAAGDYIVNGSLRKYKTCAILGTGLQDYLLLLLHGRQWHFIWSKPCIQHDHTVNSGRNTAPAVVDLSFPAQIGTTPHMEQIVIGPVSNPLSVA